MGTMGHMETVTRVGLKVPTIELSDRLRRIRRVDQFLRRPRRYEVVLPLDATKRPTRSSL